MTDHVEVRAGAYHDSVTLMLLSQTLGDHPDVDHAMVAMGTDLNIALMTEAGYSLPPAGAGDLVIAFRTTDDAIARVRPLVDQLLTERAHRAPGGAAADAPARSIRTAAARAGGTVALISVPGEHAFREAVAALEAGLHPVVFSDNVTLAHELELKQLAAELDLLVMGPDCGTVILGGTGLGFANAVVPGPIGLVSASGTGAQQVSCLCDTAGLGVSHVIGLGGRDLTDAVGGLSAVAALRHLDADPGIEVIGLIAKEIGPRSRSALDRVLGEIDTPLVEIPTADLTEGTARLVAAGGTELPEPRSWPSASRRAGSGGRLLGLYSGGTLAAEAQLVATESGAAAEIVDLGDDEYTRGRPHPMIDHRLRIERLAAARTDTGVGAVLCDVVLGHGAAADPAGALAPAIADLDKPAFVALIGTESDPQGLDDQAAALAAAGADVYASNSAAARAAADSVGGVSR